MSPGVIYSLIVFVPALLFLVQAQFLALRRLARTAGSSARASSLVAIAFVTVLASLCIALAVGAAVLFGPLRVMGLGNDLLWFTMFPALAIGLYAGAGSSRLLGASLLRRLVT